MPRPKRNYNKWAQSHGFISHYAYLTWWAAGKGYLTYNEYQKALKARKQNIKLTERQLNSTVRFKPIKPKLNITNNCLQYIWIKNQNSKQFNRQALITENYQELPNELSESILDLEEEYQSKHLATNLSKASLIEHQNLNLHKSQLEVLGVDQHLPNELSEDILDLEEEYQQVP